jgi:CRP-like cAMP-binding protein
MLSVIEKVIFLQHVDVFAEVPTEQLAYLAAIAEEITVVSGDEVFHEHEHADALYLVIEGSVRLHRNGDEIMTAGPRQAFGAWALFDEEPRVATASATEETRMLRMEREDFYEILADHVQVTQGVLKTMVKRLRGLVEKVR